MKIRKDELRRLLMGGTAEEGDRWGLEAEEFQELWDHGCVFLVVLRHPDHGPWGYSYRHTSGDEPLGAFEEDEPEEIVLKKVIEEPVFIETWKYHWEDPDGNP